MNAALRSTLSVLLAAGGLMRRRAWPIAQAGSDATLPARARRLRRRPAGPRPPACGKPAPRATKRGRGGLTSAAPGELRAERAGALLRCSRRPTAPPARRAMRGTGRTTGGRQRAGGRRDPRDGDADRGTHADEFTTAHADDPAGADDRARADGTAAASLRRSPKPYSCHAAVTKEPRGCWL